MLPCELNTDNNGNRKPRKRNVHAIHYLHLCTFEGLKLGTATTTASTTGTTAAAAPLQLGVSPLQLGAAKTTAPTGLTLGSVTTTTASTGLKLGGMFSFCYVHSCIQPSVA